MQPWLKSNNKIREPSHEVSRVIVYMALKEIDKYIYQKENCFEQELYRNKNTYIMNRFWAVLQFLKLNKGDIYGSKNLAVLL